MSLKNLSALQTAIIAIVVGVLVAVFASSSKMSPKKQDNGIDAIREIKPLRPLSASESYVVLSHEHEKHDYQDLYARAFELKDNDKAKKLYPMLAEADPQLSKWIYLFQLYSKHKEFMLPPQVSEEDVKMGKLSERSIESCDDVLELPENYSGTWCDWGAWGQLLRVAQYDKGQSHGIAKDYQSGEISEYIYGKKNFSVHFDWDTEVITFSKVFEINLFHFDEKTNKETMVTVFDRSKGVDHRAKFKEEMNSIVKRIKLFDEFYGVTDLEHLDLFVN